MPQREDAQPAAFRSAWGMGEARAPGDGSPGSAEPRGSGSPRRVSFFMPVWDAVLVIIGLLIWTGVFIFFFAQHCAGTACH
jgi:hypothetical protein